MKRNEKTTAIKLAQNYVENFLSGYSVENAGSISRLLISEVTNMPYSEAVLKKPMLTKIECDRIDGFCDRLAMGEPVQQVLGHAPSFIR